MLNPITIVLYLQMGCLYLYRFVLYTFFMHVLSSSSATCYFTHLAYTVSPCYCRDLLSAMLTRHLLSCFCNTEFYSPAICCPVPETLNATHLPSVVLFLQHWMLLTCHLLSFPFPSGRPALGTWQSADRRAVERLWNILTCHEKNISENAGFFPHKKIL